MAPDATGLVIETGRRFTAVPEAMIRSCAEAGLPLIQLCREVPFVKLTEAVHAGIVQEQFRALGGLAARPRGLHRTVHRRCWRRRNRSRNREDGEPRWSSKT